MKNTLLQKLFIGSLVALGATLVVTQAFTYADLFDKVSSNNAIISLEKPPVKNVEIDPSTIVTEGVKDNLFEAEHGLYEGVTGLSGQHDHKCVADSYLINQGFSGSICLTNISRGTNSKNNSLSFTFNSDKDEIVNMEVTVTGLSSDTAFSKIVKTTVNDEQYGCDEIVLSANNGKFVAQHYTSKFNHSLTTVTIPIKLREGQNTIKFTTRLPGDNMMFGFDCINIKTTANLTEFTPNFWGFNDVTVSLTTKPTANTTGVIHLTHEVEGCNTDVYYPLPSLGDGYANNTYTRVDNTSTNTFDYYFPNKEFGITVGTINKGPFKLTIDSPYVSVNAGGNSLEIIATEGIDESLITAHPPYGKKIVGWYNKNNKNEYWMGSTYRMPDRDVTICPVFDGEVYVDVNDKATAADVHSGKVNIVPDRNTNYFRDSACTGSFTVSNLRSQLQDTIIVLDSGEADTAIQFNHSSGIKAGEQIATMIPCAWADGTKKLQTVLQNQGSAALSFDFFIFTSGSKPELARNSPLSLTTGEKAYTTITLQPGEVKVLDWSMQRGHNTMMHGFYFNENASNLSLAMYQYIDARHTLKITNSDKVTFSDGSSSKLVEPHVGAPEIKTTLEEGEVLTSFKSGNNTYKSDLSDFVMGLTDVSLTPVIISNPVERTLTIDGTYAKFANGTNEIKLFGGETLPSGITVTAPDNMTHFGWVNTKTGEYYKDEFVMPNENTTIAPVFDYTDASYFLDSKVYKDGLAVEDNTSYSSNVRSGKAQIYEAGNILKADKCNGFGISSNSSEFMKTGAVKTSVGYYERSASFNYDGQVTNENYFTLFKQQQNWNYAAKKTIKATFTNYGNEDLIFTLSLCNASSNPQGSKLQSKQFTVAKNSSVCIDWDISNTQKDSLIIFFESNTELNNGLHLAMNLYFQIEGK